MDKISSIIHSSPRVMAVDMRESSVRPGTPAFGRLEGVSSLAKAAPNLGDTAAKATAIANEATTWKSKDLKSAAMAAEMSKSFFAKTPPPAAPVAEEMNMPSMPPMKPMTAQSGFFAERESVPTGFKSESPMAFRSTALARMPSFDAGEMESVAMQPEGLFPKGSFIDRTA